MQISKILLAVIILSAAAGGYVVGKAPSIGMNAPAAGAPGGSFVPPPMPLMPLNAQVDSVKGDVLTLKNIVAFPGQTQEKTKTVTLGADTHIIDQEPKDFKTMQEETWTFQKAISAPPLPGAPPPIPPMPFVEKALTVSDLKPDDHVIVIMREGKKANEAARITRSATSIAPPPPGLATPPAAHAPKKLAPEKAPAKPTPVSEDPADTNQ